VTILALDNIGLQNICNVIGSPISYLHTPNVVGMSGSAYGPTGVWGCANNNGALETKTITRRIKVFWCFFIVRCKNTV
jgi:hypothetical protein